MRVIGHRGDSANHPENTLAAFEAAITAGADGVEFDVRLTADGHPIVMHDDDVERTTGATGSISRMTLSEVRALNAGATRGGNATVPTLQEVIETLDGRTSLFVEFKAIPLGDGFSAMPVVEVAAPVLQGLSEVVVVSFDPGGLDAVRASLPQAEAALACFREPGQHWMIDLAAERGYPLVLMQFDQIDPEVVARAHEAGLSVMAWWVTPQDIEHVRALGLDGVLAADPAGVRASL